MDPKISMSNKQAGIAANTSHFLWKRKSVSKSTEAKVVDNHSQVPGLSSNLGTNNMR